MRRARTEQLKSATKRRDVLRAERDREIARIRAELVAERTSEKARELRRLERRVAQAARREAERRAVEDEQARLREALATVRKWAPPWPPTEERLRHARAEARAMWSST